MTVILPESLSAATGWRLVDYNRAAYQSDPAAGGLATLNLEQLPGDEMWLIDHAVISCDSATPTTARWYETSVSPFTLLDGTAAGNFDVADWPTGLMVGPSRSLVVQWAGAADGARGTLTVQRRVLRRS